MDVRDALHAGRNELIKPISRAASRQTAPVAGVIARVRNAGMKLPPGPLLTTEHIPEARKIPIAPPISEISEDSPTIIPRIAPGVNPSVFRIPTSRIRSRTDIEIVLAETSKIVNVTAPQIAIIKSRTLPRNEIKL